MTGSFVSAATRQRVRDIATPVALGLGKVGLTPNALTLLGFGGTALAAIAAANQWWLAAAGLVLAFGIFDLFDGALARATGQVSRLGAFLDSTFDRAGEALVYIGVIAACAGAGFDLGATSAAAAMAAAFMVSYTRAKAESLGFSPGNGLMNVGVAPREVRVAITVVGFLAIGVLGEVGPATDSPANAALLITFVTIAVLATITTIQRILSVRSQSKEG